MKDKKEKHSGEEKQASRIKLFLSKKDKDKEKEKAEKSGGGGAEAADVKELAQAEGRSASKDEQKRKRRSISLLWKWRTARNAASADEPMADEPTDSPPHTANESFGAEQQSTGRNIDPDPEAEHLVLRGESPTDAKDNVDRHRSYRTAKERGEVPRGMTPTADQQSLPLLDEPPPAPAFDKPDKGASSSKPRAMAQSDNVKAATFLGGVGGGTISSPLGVLTSALSTKDYVTEKSTGRRYIRGKLLGKGGFAKCFEFIDEKTHVKYAGKIIAKARFLKTHQKEKYMQIMREIDLHRSLQHPNIVGFYSYFEDNDNMNIVLELCTRRSLVEMVRVRKILTEPEVRYFLKQMVEGCRYIHGRNIIHRDFKLGNMLLSDTMEIKIADFGLATQVMYEGEKKITVCGTPNYIAPEVLGKRGHSFEVDIWALGCILYALLVGCPPFETTSLKETYARIMANRYYIPAHVALPARSLIRKLLNGEPTKRPNFDQILNDEFFKSGFMPHSLPPQCCEQVPKFTSRQQNSNNNLLEIPSSSTSLLDTIPAQEDKRSRHREREKKSADNVLAKSEKRRSLADSDKAALLDKKMDKIELGSAEMLDLKTSPVKKRSSKEIKDKEKQIPPKAEVESSSSEESETDSDSSEEETESDSDEEDEWGARRLPASVQKQEMAKLAQRRASSGLEGKTVSRTGSDKSQQLQQDNRHAVNRSDDILADRPSEKLTGSKPSAAEPFSRPKSKSLEMKRAKELQHRVLQNNNEKMWQLAEKESRKEPVGSTLLRENVEKPSVTDEKFNTDVLMKLSTIALTVQSEGRPEGRQTPLGRVTPQTATNAATPAQDRQLIPEHLAEKSNARSGKDAATAALLKQSKTADSVTQLAGSKSRNSLSESADDVTPPPDLKSSKRFLSERGKSGEKRDVRKEIEARRQQAAKSSGAAETAADDAKVADQDHLLNYDKSLKRNTSDKKERRKQTVDEQAKKLDDGGKKMEDEAAAAAVATPARKLSRQKPLEKGLFNPFAPREIVTNIDDDPSPPSAFSPIKSFRDEVKVSSKDEVKVAPKEEVKPSKDEGKLIERLSRSPPQSQGDDIPRIKLTTIDRSPLRRQGSGGSSKQKDDISRRQPAMESTSPPVAMDTSTTSAVSQERSSSRPTSYQNATPIDLEVSSRNVGQPAAAAGSTSKVTSGVGVGRKNSSGKIAASTGQGQQGQRSLAAPPPADRDMSKSPSDMLFTSTLHSGPDRPGSYALPSGPEDELHKITSSLAQWQSARKPMQVVTPLPGEPLMEEAEEGGSPMWEGAEGEDMTPVSDDVTSTADLPGSDAAFSSSDPGEVIPGTALALYQMLKLFSSDIPSRNNPPPIHDISPLYVAKWVDYSNKYGFGFQLSDNSVGVLFNDKTRMIFTVNGSQRMVHYSDVTNQVTSFPWDAVPAPYHKKSTLLFHYAQYMDKHLIPGAASSSSSLSRSVTSTSPVFLKKWFRANKAIVLYLSNGTLQVNFLHDHTKVIISSVSTEYCVTFINNKRLAVTYNLRNLATFGCRREMSERLIYARRMMENVMNFEGVAV